MSLVGVGAEDGEDGALLARLRQQLVDQHLPVGEAEVRPRLAFVGAEPGGKTEAFHPQPNRQDASDVVGPT